MKKIRFLSDLHLEFGTFDLSEASSDVVVLAGDIGVGIQGGLWAVRQSERLGVPFVMIAGNHEFYDGAAERGDMKSVYEDLHALAGKSGGALTFLQNEVAVVGGVRFVGATLWTDFNLFGHQYGSAKDAGRGMNDFRLIRKDRDRWFTPMDSIGEHKASRLCIEQAAGVGPTNLPFVVVTHHAPSIRSVSPYWRKHGRTLNPAFASNLDTLVMKSGAALWVHGHMHDQLDYEIGGTRVVCNPRGYAGHDMNPKFDDQSIIEV